MWLFTRWGFFSCACTPLADESGESEVDPNGLSVRSRLRSHLEKLQSHLPDLVGNCEIEEYPDSDYRYRIYVDKAIWSQVMISLCQELNYDNFREEMVQEHSMDDPGYVKRLSEVASIMKNLQNGEAEAP